jgi:hypothetical protein
MNLRAAQVRIYVDADIIGLGKIIASLRNDVTYPGDPGAVIHNASDLLALSPALTFSTRNGYPR